MGFDSVMGFFCESGNYLEFEVSSKSVIKSSKVAPLNYAAALP